MNGTTSESSHAISRVSQGLILGPLLFLIYIDDMTNGPFSPGICIILYADDILLYHTISSNSDYSHQQSDANTVQNWVNCNHMFLNPSKCKFMLISCKLSRMNNPSIYNPSTITINGQMLETVPTFKYLGLLLTSDLSWSKPIEGVCTKANEKTCAYCTVNSTSMLTRKLFANCIYPLYSPPLGVCSTSLGPTLDLPKALCGALSS